MTFQYSDKNPSMTVTYSSTDAMHTKMEIIVAGIADRNEAQNIVSEIWDEVYSDDKRLNRFSSDGEIYRINSSAYNHDVEIDEELFMILRMCQVFNKSTFGFFDITANMISRTGENNFNLDDKAHTVRFLSPETRIDLGGFAKGYTLDKAVKKLRQHDIKYALINAGDSSSFGVGTHPYGDYWPIGLEHPYFKGKVMHEFHIKNNALSISGKDRKGRGHIIDPRTGNTIEKEEIIAVSGASPLVAEVLSTALYVAPEKYRKEIIMQFPSYEAITITPLCNGEKTLAVI